MTSPHPATESFRVPRSWRREEDRCTDEAATSVCSSRCSFGFGVLQFLAAPTFGADAERPRRRRPPRRVVRTESSGTSSTGAVRRSAARSSTARAPPTRRTTSPSRTSRSPSRRTTAIRSGRRSPTQTASSSSTSPPGKGNYVGLLDTSTLPKGVELPTSAATLKFRLGPGQSRVLLFDLNAAARSTTGKFDEFLQAVVDGTNFGLIIAMCAVGLSLIYGTTQLVNFAHGELVTLGAIVAYYFNADFGWPLLVAAPAAVVVVGAFGWLLDAGILGTTASPWHRTHRSDGDLHRARAGDAQLLPVHVRRHHHGRTATTTRSPHGRSARSTSRRRSSPAPSSASWF